MGDPPPFPLVPIGRPQESEVRVYMPRGTDYFGQILTRLEVPLVLQHGRCSEGGLYTVLFQCGLKNSTWDDSYGSCCLAAFLSYNKRVYKSP